MAARVRPWLTSLDGPNDIASTSAVSATGVRVPFTRRRGPRPRLQIAPRRQRGRRDVLRDGHSTARGPRVTRRHGLRRVLRRVRGREDALGSRSPALAAERLLKSSTVDVSFLEIAGGCCDLLKDRETVKLLADAGGTIQPVGLSKNQCASLDDFDAKTKNANKLRATAATERNSVSSRSHAVCQLKIKGGGRLRLVDLAGSERLKAGAENYSDERRARPRRSTRASRA